MLCRSTRSALIFAVVALYGGVSLVGPGHHAVPGCGHDAGVSVRACSGEANASRLAAPPVTESDGCPACNYLAQGQLLAAPPDTSSRLAPVDLRPVERPSRPTLRLADRPRPRAPPLFPAA